MQATKASKLVPSLVEAQVISDKVERKYIFLAFKQIRAVVQDLGIDTALW